MKAQTIIIRRQIACFHHRTNCFSRFEGISQAAKYVPYLEIMFGPDYEIIPVLVLTAAQDMFRFETIGGKDMVLLKRSPNLN